ncbi:MAG: glucose-6-phosphate dehydrogenase [Mariprofundales bacterium]|nr:glucose-6-phosphate dehydrogenase [Mariprofundales bacterium]
MDFLLNDHTESDTTQQIRGSAPTMQLNNFTTPILNDAPSDPCLMVIFGASGDLTKRLLLPSLFHLYCDGLLPNAFAILGIALDDFDDTSFRSKMGKDVRQYSRRGEFDSAAWSRFCTAIHYQQGRFDDETTFDHLQQRLLALDSQFTTHGNTLFYMATPPALFGMISAGLSRVGLQSGGSSWRRIIVEKPFGNDLSSAQTLNREMLSFWQEEQIYRIDHYLGKETVQNILAFRFANGIFEPLWNRTHIDHIQITSTEQVGVEWRGGYYDRSGVIRDMIQNHLFQIMAYLCMEPPTSFAAEAIRNEKFKLLSAVRIMRRDEVAHDAVRGQYIAGINSDGSAAKGYRQEAHVDPHSNTETYAALKLRIDNWRWHGVPVFLRSGKGLKNKATEIVVQFRSAPSFTFEGTPAVEQLEANQLIFHIYPHEGIELRFLAKRPGPSIHMRKVNMHFEYEEAFEAQPGTGYETMLYDCMRGDAALFSRSDLVESAWKIVQPILDAWQEERVDHLPEYPFGSWGPKAAYDLLTPERRRWLAHSAKQAVERVPLFKQCGKAMRNDLAMMLKPKVFEAGDEIVSYGSIGNELFIIDQGSVEILNQHGEVKTVLDDGKVFGELSLLVTKHRQATVRALTYCAMYTLNKRDFHKVLKDRPEFAKKMMVVAQERYQTLVQVDNS